MTAEARAALLEAKEEALTDHVIEWDGTPVRKIRKGFANAVRRAGLGWYEDDPTRPGKRRWVTNVTPHTLRHTALTSLEEEGVPIEMISKLHPSGLPTLAAGALAARGGRNRAQVAAATVAGADRVEGCGCAIVGR
jgi:hypothetical protein